MAALTSDITRRRRGPPRGGEYGYPVAPGEQVFRNSLVGINAAGQMQRIQTAGTVAVLGLAAAAYNNTTSAAASPVLVEALRGIWQLTVPAATPANINAPVYVTDDNTVTLTNSGGLLVAGALDGFDAGLTYVRLTGD
jgi:hypothetical protein